MEFLGNPLPYQEEDLGLIQTRMKNPGRYILTHKTGLGKTFITLADICRRESNRVLVVGTTKSLAIWLIEIPRWTGITPTLITKNTKNREQIWKDCCSSKDPRIVLINFELFLILVGKVKGRQQVVRRELGKWDHLVVDEAHKKIRSHNTQTLATLKCVNSRFIAILSATLPSRGPQDMWGALNLVDPSFFSSYWRFVAQHCFVFPGEYGQMIGPVKDPNYTKGILRQFCISRGNEVRSQMPPIRQSVTLSMDKEQADLYYEYLDQMLLELSDGRILVSANRLAQGIRLRQLALCPKILDPLMPLGTGAEYILEELEEDSHVVIFAPYKVILAVMREEITKAYPDVAVFTLQGGMLPDDVNNIIRAWKASRGVMLCTIASAESFALDTVNVAYFLGAEYDPTLNIQAEGRLQRIDSKQHGITIRYIIVAGTVEEDVKDIINDKVINVSKFLDTYLQKVATTRSNGNTKIPRDDN